MRSIVAPGFLGSAQVRTALEVGGVAAVVSAVVGVFTIIRGQSFAGHALTDAAATGGSAVPLLGINPLLGFLLGTVTGAGAMEVVGVRHARGRDLATGVVLGASMGLASLLLYLDTTRTATTGAPQQVLFGSIFSTVPGTTAMTIGLGAASIGLLAVVYRPLLLSSISPDIATARGVRVRVVGLAYMLSLAFAVGLSALAVGSILSTALLVGPPATALRITRSIRAGLVVSVATGLSATWFGVLLAYDSGEWLSGNGLPVSFFIVAVVFLYYLAAEGLAACLARSRRRFSRLSQVPGIPRPERAGS